ncbi:MAG TPA: NADPH-dependent FMN reductase [Spirochaetia bacterium]|nr:NADPH-dependent FMN reductase [Spirochaetia bacterium]
MINGEYQVLGIAGSLRKGSFNRGLLRAAVNVKPQGMNIDICDISRIPLFNEDLRVDGGPDAVREFKDRIAGADGLLFAVPEYNYSMAGVFKNAIDWASRPIDTSPLVGKPIAMMGAGGGLGAGRAQYHFRQAAVFVNMIPMNRPELMVPHAWDKFAENGDLKDETYLPRIAEFLTAFVAWIKFVKAGQAAQ